MDRWNAAAFHQKDQFPAQGLALAQSAFQVADSIGYLKGKADALHIAGVLHLYLGNHAQSLEMLLQALGLRRETGDSTGMGRSLNNLGLLYAREDKDSLALICYREALGIRVRLRDSLGMAYTLFSLAETFAQLGEPDSATYFGEYGMTYAHLIHNDRARALGYSIMGDLALQTGNLSAASRNHQLALEIREVLKDRYERPRNLIGLGEIARRQQAYSQAQRYLETAIQLSQQTRGLTWQVQARTTLAQVLADQGAHGQAYAMLIQAQQVEDSLHHIRETQRLSGIEASYQLSLKQNQINLLKEKQANYQLRQYSLLAIIGLILLLGGLGFFYYRYRVLNQAHRQLALKQHEIEAKNAELEYFADRLAHDLREPLRTISSYTTLIGSNYAHQLDERGRTFMNFVTEGVQHMNRLVVDLHRYAKLGREGLEFGPVDLAQLIPEVQKQLQQAIAESGASFHMGPLPVIEADHTSLALIFQNLFANAIKFAGNQPPWIEVVYADEGDRHLIQVIDRGIGMSQDFQERAFMAFAREHSRAMYPGTGLGLAICAKVMEVHQGSIGVESSPGAGSTFSIRLPKQLVH